MTTLLFIALSIAFVFFVIKPFKRRRSKGDDRPLRKNDLKGRYGEMNMAALLKALPADQYRVFNDLMVSRNRHSAQIDHVVVSRYGVFVIETKNYKGWIRGSVNSEHWVQTLRGNKNELYNPLLQNNGHIRALSRMLNLDESNFFSIVAFSDDARIKPYIADNVMGMSQVCSAIRSHSELLLSERKVEQICDSLAYLNISSSDARRRHVDKIKATVDKKNAAFSKGICPKCGGKLVIRTGEHGRYYGCQNYPNCMFMDECRD